MNRSLTLVPGLTVGHAMDPQRRTGCTVVLGPFRGAAEVRGLATGSRELDTLDPRHLVPRVDAVLLTGGSAFGLAAADGVVSWLEEQGRGYQTGVVPVPIVPAGVIFDLTAPSGVRPDAAMGRAACRAASTDPVAEGRVGVGAGATVGKWAGRDAAMHGGVGCWSTRSGPYAIGALAVVNALGNVYDARGEMVAGPRVSDGAVLDPDEALAGNGADGDGWIDPIGGTNTTLAVVATDAPLGKLALAQVARVAGNALSRRIKPVHTPFDGDIVFMLSTASEQADPSAAELLSLGVAAQAVLEEALTRAVLEGDR